MHVVEIESLCFGGEETALPLNTVSARFHTDTITLRELISRAVESQVSALNEAGRDKIAAQGRRLARLYLSDDDIEDMRRQGRIAFDANQPDGTLSVENCTRNALEGFRRKRFFVSINGVRPTSLDDAILLTSSSQAQFVRLVPLVGG